MWCCGTRFSQHGGVGLMVGLDELRALFQAHRFSDSLTSRQLSIPPDPQTLSAHPPSVSQGLPPGTAGRLLPPELIRLPRKRAQQPNPSCPDRALRWNARPCSPRPSLGHTCSPRTRAGVPHAPPARAAHWTRPRSALGEGRGHGRGAAMALPLLLLRPEALPLPPAPPPDTGKRGARLPAALGALWLPLRAPSPDWLRPHTPRGVLLPPALRPPPSSLSPSLSSPSSLPSPGISLISPVPCALSRPRPPFIPLFPHQPLHPPLILPHTPSCSLSSPFLPLVPFSAPRLLLRWSVGLWSVPSLIFLSRFTIVGSDPVPLPPGPVPVGARRSLLPPGVALRWASRLHGWRGRARLWDGDPSRAEPHQEDIW
ncbi:uncharacterized protein LOC128849226 [Cuculus canorus]|uniref:uncharacterized protein LOC128849226 n=1 Tax=Cuculus canorus TaxID=55661 RepID=UPI0023AA5C19|nr:uncharacterized protein LOC128849226 [Cuculus canorus]